MVTATTSPLPEEAHALTPEHLEAAHGRIRPYVHRTPVLTSATLDERVGARLFLKCENFQKVGAFKYRGATHALTTLGEEERRRGVVTHSSGNHAQALALAARTHGVTARVVMPRNAPAVKQAAVRGYGAEVILCEPTLKARESETQRVMEATGAVLIHPFDDVRIIAGQASAARELLEEQPQLEVLLVPVGGGGLASGTALAARFHEGLPRVIGVEPAGADDAVRSLATGQIQPSINPQTVADGLLTSLGPQTFGVLRRDLESIVTVSEEAILEAMRWLWERVKIVVEPSAAVTLAALFEGKVPDVNGRRIGLLLTGGNVDLGRLPWGATKPPA